MTYRVKVDPRALRELADLTPVVRERVTKRIDALSTDPRPGNSLPLAGDLRGSFRIRVGDYRVSYSIDGEAGVVRVWAVGHRRTFYDEAHRRRR
jgi:mRNA interferase RelE/StbE